MNPLFTIVPIIIAAIWVFVLVKIISSVAKAAAARRDDEASPERNGEATVVDKRERSANDLNGDYFVTFEDTEGNRSELYATAEQYGSLARGDRGQVTFRGRRLLSFTRFSSAYTAPSEPASSDEWHKCPSCGATYKGSVCDYCDTPWHEG